MMCLKKKYKSYAFVFVAVHFIIITCNATLSRFTDCRNNNKIIIIIIIILLKINNKNNYHN